MKSLFLLLTGVGVFTFAVRSVVAQEPNPCSPKKALTTGPVLDPQALADRIDQLIAARWANGKVQPASPASDAEFLRRVHLDLAGRIPCVTDLDAFLEDVAPYKRQKRIEDLLKSNLYVKHFADVWRSLLIPQNNNDQVPVAIGNFERWLREKLGRNTPYDIMVQELLTAASASMAMQRNRGRGMNASESTPVAFYQANELKPENLAASTSRLFLGIKLECAQCHDHPHANWTRQQFWEFAAFFSGVQSRGPGMLASVQEVPDVRTIKMPRTGDVVRAHYLDGTEPRWQPGMKARSALASWVTMTNNPYFARTAANRLWAHFFGIGLVDPVDEMGEENPPSHPELLDELARQLVAHNFDLKYLIRAITYSQTYQRSSKGMHPSQNDPRLFARMAVRGMTQEQLFDSLVQATYLHTESGALDAARAQFLARFPNQEKRTESHTSILQALALMNGQIVADMTSPDSQRSVAFTAYVDFPGWDNAKRINQIYMGILSRRPSAEEAARIMKYVNSGGIKKSEKAALSDVAWTLLNSAEFMLNH
jgi:hypothetical protein